MGAQNSQCKGRTGRKSFQYTSLTNPPTNLKEAIDWVLRISERDTKDTGSLRGYQAIQGLANAIKQILENNRNGYFLNLHKVLIQYKEYIEENKNRIIPSLEGILIDLINCFVKCLSRFIGYDENGNGTITGQGIAIGRNGPGTKLKPNGPSEPWESINEKNKSAKNVGYALVYDPKRAKWNDSWKEDHTEAQTCAQIFLIAVTLIFEGLTTLYWKCSAPNKWSKERFNAPTSNRLSAYLVKQGFDLNEINAFYVPSLKNQKRKDSASRDRANEGAIIHGVLAYACDEFTKVMRLQTKTPGQNEHAFKSYEEFTTALVNCAKDDAKKLQTIKTKKYCVSVNECSTACATCRILRSSDAYSTFKDYPITKLYILAVLYRTATDRCYKSNIFKALGAVGCGAGIGTAAYFTNVFGFGPIIAGFFS
ncbi:variant erythrocyte surface antigen-1 family protein [Babesia caballi]|uniref:Variant erythrocyte surface antigen-1 family protein n=1 Tax=Babesia caballi TaxID=5871 RepID=A0AAV4LP35_BABCB|nr:variant erythrocyte surface antigen-1 family protein [Babesia caballi]